MSVDPTSLASYATNLQQSQLSQAVSMRVAKKTLDVAEQQGQAAIALLQSAAQVAKSQEPGKGGLVDVSG